MVTLSREFQIFVLSLPELPLQPELPLLLLPEKRTTLPREAGAVSDARRSAGGLHCSANCIIVPAS